MGETAGHVAVKRHQILGQLANLHNDDAALDECVRLLEPVRAAWIAIDPDASVAPKAQ